jgi:two-component system, NarL family, nitrate/nitrite response regulator NarL
LELILVTPVRLMGDGIAACLSGRADMRVRAIVSNMTALRSELQSSAPSLVLIDVTQGVDIYDVRGIAMEWPELPLVALGLLEQRQEVIRCGRAGFTGYVARDASTDAMCSALADVVAGKLACPAEISGGLLRALFHAERSEEPAAASMLTCREGQVLCLLGQGLSNKEIARELCVSVATVKHHVHQVFDKLKFQRRSQAMRWVRDAPRLAALRPARSSA